MQVAINTPLAVNINEPKHEATHMESPDAHPTMVRMCSGPKGCPILFEQLGPKLKEPLYSTRSSHVVMTFDLVELDVDVPGSVSSCVRQWCRS